MVEKISQNIAGRFYVDTNCINCSLCPEIAPDVFATNHEDGYEYVIAQPCNETQLKQVEEAMLLCPASAIQDTGSDISSNG